MSSRLDPILDAVVQRIAGRGFAVGGVVLPVYKRKATQRNRTLDPDRFITISKSATPEQVTRWTFGRIRTDYLIDVIVLTPHTGPETDQAVYAEIRDQIVTDFSRPPLPGTDVFEMRADPADWLRPYGDAGSEWDWFACRITASVVSSNGGL